MSVMYVLALYLAVPPQYFLWSFHKLLILYSFICTCIVCCLFAKTSTELLPDSETALYVYHLAHSLFIGFPYKLKH